MSERETHTWFMLEGESTLISLIIFLLFILIFIAFSSLSGGLSLIEINH